MNIFVNDFYSELSTKEIIEKITKTLYELDNVVDLLGSKSYKNEDEIVKLLKENNIKYSKLHSSNLANKFDLESAITYIMIENTFISFSPKKQGNLYVLENIHYSEIEV